MLSCPPKCRPAGPAALAALTIEWPSRDAFSAWSYTNGCGVIGSVVGGHPDARSACPCPQSIKVLLSRLARQRFGDVPEHDG